MMLLPRGVPPEYRKEQIVALLAGRLQSHGGGRDEIAFQYLESNQKRKQGRGVSVQVVSKVACLEEVGVQLGTEQSNMYQAGLKTTFSENLKETSAAGGADLGGKIRKWAVTPPPGVTPLTPHGRILPVLGTGTMTTSMMMTPSTPRPGASPPTARLGGSFTASVATAAAWAARAAYTPPRPSPTPPSRSTCMAGLPPTRQAGAALLFLAFGELDLRAGACLGPGGQGGGGRRPRAAGPLAAVGMPECGTLLQKSGHTPVSPL